MKFQTEFNYCALALILIVILYAVFSFTMNTMLQILMALLSTVIGSALVMLGFWGSDFAFAMASGQLKQEKVKGKVNGQRGKVYVPFMKNYTPLEWWNLNWFLTFVGVILVAAGALIFGVLVGIFIF